MCDFSSQTCNNYAMLQGALVLLSGKGSVGYLVGMKEREREREREKKKTRERDIGTHRQGHRQTDITNRE